MEKHLIYCSACDQEVTVMYPDETGEKDVVELDGAICLHIDDVCTGSLCPISAIPLSRASIKPPDVAGPHMG